MKLAVIGCAIPVLCGSALVVCEAVPLDSGTVASNTPLSRNSTLPVTGLAPGAVVETVAVNVTFWP
jgi:hypothetical protein